ncbi:hypothetical protein FISHEDRAFT_41576 [Fistulina hepatica ATCC 64428]|nr:hypothetical protein FISHEDRAFT_41576 [Fistulina hepatica ATCC 64428]
MDEKESLPEGGFSATEQGLTDIEDDDKPWRTVAREANSEDLDPFLLDDDDDDDPPSQDSHEQQNPDKDKHDSASEQIDTPDSRGTPAVEVPLAPDKPPPALPPNVFKPVPSPPPDLDEEEEEDAPDIYLPALVASTMFLPIPNTDPLSSLLAKYIHPPDSRPARNATGEWQGSDFHTLVMTSSWRSLARMARDRLVSSDPEDLALVLGLWYLRLSSLARLRLTNQVVTECNNLYSVLNNAEPAARTWIFERILPFELEVMFTRVKYWQGDNTGYLDALTVLLNRCKAKSRAAKNDSATVTMWKERGARILIIMASQLVEMREVIAAAQLLEPLCVQSGVSSPALRSALARIYLQGGNMKMAIKHLTAVQEDQQVEPVLRDVNAAILACAEGDWAAAERILNGVLEEDAQNFVAANNLSVALLGQGKVKEGIQVLENALQSSPSSVAVSEPFLFNLSTLYELRSSSSFDKKRNLLIEVAKWGGDGLRASCLKMPTS